MIRWMTEGKRTCKVSADSLPRAGFILVVLLLVVGSPTTAQQRSRIASAEPARLMSVDLQGHRGARGLLPENSVPSVLKALDLGVETVEVDVVVTRDRKVVLSHEPWMSSLICRKPDGGAVEAAVERSFNLFEMDYDEVAGFDCGSRGHPAFPDQRPTAVAKPLLRDVVRIADGYADVIGRARPRYNVEIKSAPEHDGIFHPAPDTFVILVHDVLVGENVLHRTTIQSFDPRALRAVRTIDPAITVALLVSNEDGFQANLDRLGYTPDVYSPHYRLVDAALIQAAHAAQVDVIPWTVNEADGMTRLLQLGVQGLITDYPDIGRDAVDAFLHRSRRN